MVRQKQVVLFYMHTTTARRTHALCTKGSSRIRLFSLLCSMLCSFHASQDAECNPTVVQRCAFLAHLSNTLIPAVALNNTWLGGLSLSINLENPGYFKSPV